MTSTFTACFGDAEYVADLQDPTRRGLTGLDGPCGWFSDIIIGEGSLVDVDGCVVDAGSVHYTVPVPVSEDWEPDVYTDALRRAGWEPIDPLPTRPVRQFPVRSIDDLGRTDRLVG
ncbi:hypothetical protein E7744_00990 [Citricoccus sp. SGAir0253]|uniref:hypothetical protein n=1 Tax=Citricoccus sp. SGAir0253 TaxID=2567881 RepID=UPI0010CCED99|nr:hypothetical protein [Citricoccus sp. SGAir0253]QCU76959.1 hypothetical protein E7744_00990 [Citricoccus sp. SGAir0253]